MLKKRKGISLIVLIITIIVIIILASVIVMSFSNNNPIGRANEAKFKSDLSSFRDELDSVHNDNSFNDSTYAPENVNVDVGDYAGLRRYIPDITEKYANKLLIKKGKLLYIGDDSGDNKSKYEKYHDDKEEEWAKSIGIQSPYGQVGDANGDGQITEEDVAYIENYTIGAEEVVAITDRKLNAFDANDDGSIDIKDSVVIDKYLKYEIDTLPYTGSI